MTDELSNKTKIEGNRKKSTLNDLAREAGQVDKDLIDDLLGINQKKKKPKKQNGKSALEEQLESQRSNKHNKVDNIPVTQSPQDLFAEGYLLYSVFNYSGQIDPDTNRFNDNVKSFILRTDLTNKKKDVIARRQGYVHSIAHVPLQGVFDAGLYEYVWKLLDEYGSTEDRIFLETFTFKIKEMEFIPGSGLYGIEDNFTSLRSLCDTSGDRLGSREIISLTKEVSCITQVDLSYLYGCANNKLVKLIRSQSGELIAEDSSRELLFKPTAAEFIPDYGFVVAYGGRMAKVTDENRRALTSLDLLESSPDCNKIRELEWVPDIGLLHCGAYNNIYRILDADKQVVNEIFIETEQQVTALHYVPFTDLIR
ncbi:hypothetical protein HOK51_07545 [Candidatus Woesearchaeota archaeon]|nr:hypothetical protein [Candidatus Woesearchaeota archaeon]MBT6519677.1 hypothetical protein [Candidatus Woesearchaeota archaeon]MBT7367368.1 hypothetical protein [Candidatus Woesearchaeota archaeon]